jgi:hypothetical protein
MYLYEEEYQDLKLKNPKWNSETILSNLVLIKFLWTD